MASDTIPDGTSAGQQVLGLVLILVLLAASPFLVGWAIDYVRWALHIAGAV